MIRPFVVPMANGAGAAAAVASAIHVGVGRPHLVVVAVIAAAAAVIELGLGVRYRPRRAVGPAVTPASPTTPTVGASTSGPPRNRPQPRRGQELDLDRYLGDTSTRAQQCPHCGSWALDEIDNWDGHRRCPTCGERWRPTAPSERPDLVLRPEGRLHPSASLTADPSIDQETS